MWTEDGGVLRQRIMLGAALVVLVAAAVLAWTRLGGDSPYQISTERVFKCCETGKIYEYSVKEGDREPYWSPHTERRTGYRPEPCYWTQDENGDWKAKLEPDWVILRQLLDPTSDEETYCPVCGRKVVPRNPRPPKELMDEARAEAGQ